jgi:GNAT superfamily N-acetyltransferase
MPEIMSTILSFEKSILAGGVLRNPRIYVLDVFPPEGMQGKALANVLVERIETVRNDPKTGQTLEGTIQLFFNRIESKYSQQMTRHLFFAGSYTLDLPTGAPQVSLTSASASKGTVFLDLDGLHGHRIGTYLMNQVVKWAMQWPDSSVREVELMEGQADPGNKDRRNRFYEQFGLVFDYTDAERRQGRSRAMLVKELRAVETWKKNIREREFCEFLGELMFERDHATNGFAHRNRACAQLIAEQRRVEAKPIRWALKLTWWRLAPTLGWLAVIVTLGAITWSQLKT